jgi:uncharacterized protein YndB with AHSA1/START domain
MTHKITLTGMLLAAAASGALAEVADSSPNGFTVKLSLTVKAPPEEAFRKLIRIGDWWNSAHTFSGNSHNLSIEDKPMGCFCEKLPNQGGVRHMEVVYVAPGKKLVMTGGLGPLQSVASTGSMTIDVAAAEDGAKVRVIYSVAGYQPTGMNTWAAPVDTVLTEQLTRLKNYVDQGDPAPKP